MDSEPLGEPVDLIKANETAINSELNRLKTEPLTADSHIANPQLILVSMQGDYVTGGIDTTHKELEEGLNIERKYKKLPPVSSTDISTASGTVFSLKDDPAKTRYIRLDSLLYRDDDVPPHVAALMKEGYVVLDARYNRPKTLAPRK